MKRLTFLIALVLIALCAGCGGGSGSTAPNLLNACPPLPVSTLPAGSLGSIVDNMVASEMKAQGLPGLTVAIAKNGTVLYTQGYGYANLSTCKPVLPTTEFQIASVTKQFTAAAILQLHNAGKLNIDNTVLTYLPTYSFDPRITLRMLLNQTSGLDDYLNFPAASTWVTGMTVIPQKTILTAITQAPLLFTPGSAYAYSNSNYFILGAIIEAVSVLSYSNYMATHIFQPTGLAHTSYLQPSTSASPYTYTYPAVPGTTGLAVGIVDDPSVSFSTGALWSNVRDLATWDAALRNGNVIPAALFSQMVTPPASIPVYQQAGMLSPYAMGWVRDTVSGHPAIWHNGRAFSYAAFNGVFLDTGFSITVLTNVDTPVDSIAGKLTQAICTSAATASNC